MDVRFNRPQSLAHRALVPDETVCLAWGRGVGKSWFDLTSMYLDVAAWDGRERDCGLKKIKGVRQVLMLPTLKQALDVYGATLESDLAPSGDWGFLGGKIDRKTWRIRFPGGSWIHLFGAAHANAARGLRCDKVVVDECDDVPHHVFDAVIAPWFSEPWSRKIRMVSGTPRRGRQGLLYRTHRRGLAGSRDRLPQHTSVFATGYDTPDTVDPAFLAKMKLETSKEVFEREYLCNFDAAEGLVYPQFFEAFHVREAPKDARFTDILVGADHGFEDPGAIYVIGITGHGKDATAWVLSEVYEQHREDSWWLAEVRKVVETFPTARWYADPSRPGTLKDWKKVGARIQETDNTIEDGVGAVADRLKIKTVGEGKDAKQYARLYVAPQCKNLIREFGLYRRKRDPRNPDAVLEAILDKDNHAMDAVRYPLLGHFGPVQRSGKRGERSDADFANG